MYSMKYHINIFTHKYVCLSLSVWSGLVLFVQDTTWHNYSRHEQTNSCWSNSKAQAEMKRWQGQHLQISPNLPCKNHEKKTLLISHIVLGAQTVESQVLLPLLLQLLLLEPSVSATWVAQILMRVSQMAHDTFVQIVNLGQLNFFWARSKAGILLACISSSWDSDLDAMLTSNGQSRLGSGLSWATPTTPPLSTLGRKEYIRKHSWDQWSPIHNYSQNQQLRWNCCFRKSQSMAKHGKAMQSACDLSGPVRTCQESCRKVDGNCVRLLVKDWRLDLSRWVTILALNHWIGKSMESTSAEQRKSGLYGKAVARRVHQTWIKKQDAYTLFAVDLKSF